MKKTAHNAPPPYTAAELAALATHFHAERARTYGGGVALHFGNGEGTLTQQEARAILAGLGARKETQETSAARSS